MKVSEIMRDNLNGGITETETIAKLIAINFEHYVDSSKEKPTFESFCLNTYNDELIKTMLTIANTKYQKSFENEIKAIWERSKNKIEEKTK